MSENSKDEEYDKKKKAKDGESKAEGGETKEDRDGSEALEAASKPKDKKEVEDDIHQLGSDLDLKKDDKEGRPKSQIIKDAEHDDHALGDAEKKLMAASDGGEEKEEKKTLQEEKKSGGVLKALGGETKAGDMFDGLDLANAPQIDTAAVAPKATTEVSIDDLAPQQNTFVSQGDKANIDDDLGLFNIRSGVDPLNSFVYELAKDFTGRERVVSFELNSGEMPAGSYVFPGTTTKWKLKSRLFLECFSRAPISGLKLPGLTEVTTTPGTVAFPGTASHTVKVNKPDGDMFNLSTIPGRAGEMIPSYAAISRQTVEAYRTALLANVYRGDEESLNVAYPFVQQEMRAAIMQSSSMTAGGPVNHPNPLTETVNVIMPLDPAFRIDRQLANYWRLVMTYETFIEWWGTRGNPNRSPVILNDNEYTDEDFSLRGMIQNGVPISEHPNTLINNMFGNAANIPAARRAAYRAYNIVEATMRDSRFNKELLAASIAAGKSVAPGQVPLSVKPNIEIDSKCNDAVRMLLSSLNTRDAVQWLNALQTLNAAKYSELVWDIDEETYASDAACLVAGSTLTMIPFVLFDENSKSKLMNCYFKPWIQMFTQQVYDYVRAPGANGAGFFRLLNANGLVTRRPGVTAAQLAGRITTAFNMFIELTSANNYPNIAQGGALPQPALGPGGIPLPQRAMYSWRDYVGPTMPNGAITNNGAPVTWQTQNAIGKNCVAKPVDEYCFMFNDFSAFTRSMQTVGRLSVPVHRDMFGATWAQFANQFSRFLDVLRNNDARRWQKMEKSFHDFATSHSEDKGGALVAFSLDAAKVQIHPDTHGVGTNGGFGNVGIGLRSPTGQIFQRNFGEVHVSPTSCLAFIMLGGAPASTDVVESFDLTRVIRHGTNNGRFNAEFSAITRVGNDMLRFYTDAYNFPEIAGTNPVAGNVMYAGAAWWDLMFERHLDDIVMMGVRIVGEILTMASGKAETKLREWFDMRNTIQLTNHPYHFFRWNNRDFMINGHTSWSILNARSIAGNFSDYWDIWTSTSLDYKPKGLSPTECQGIVDGSAQMVHVTGAENKLTCRFGRLGRYANLGWTEVHIPEAHNDAAHVIGGNTDWANMGTVHLPLILDLKEGVGYEGFWTCTDPLQPRVTMGVQIFDMPRIKSVMQASRYNVDLGVQNCRSGYFTHQDLLTLRANHTLDIQDFMNYLRIWKKDEVYSFEAIYAYMKKTYRRWNMSANTLVNLPSFPGGNGALTINNTNAGRGNIPNARVRWDNLNNIGNAAEIGSMVHTSSGLTTGMYDVVANAPAVIERQCSPNGIINPRESTWFNPLGRNLTTDRMCSEARSFISVLAHNTTTGGAGMFGLDVAALDTTFIGGAAPVPQQDTAIVAGSVNQAALNVNLRNATLQRQSTVYSANPMLKYLGSAIVAGNESSEKSLMFIKANGIKQVYKEIKETTSISDAASYKNAGFKIEMKPNIIGTGFNPPGAQGEVLPGGGSQLGAFSQGVFNQFTLPDANTYKVVSGEGGSVEVVYSLAKQQFPPIVDTRAFCINPNRDIAGLHVPWFAYKRLRWELYMNIGSRLEGLELAARRLNAFNTMVPDDIKPNSTKKGMNGDTFMYYGDGNMCVRQQPMSYSSYDGAWPVKLPPIVPNNFQGQGNMAIHRRTLEATFGMNDGETAVSFNPITWCAPKNGVTLRPFKFTESNMGTYSTVP